MLHRKGGSLVHSYIEQQYYSRNLVEGNEQYGRAYCHVEPTPRRVPQTAAPGLVTLCVSRCTCLPPSLRRLLCFDDIVPSDGGEISSQRLMSLSARPENSTIHPDEFGSTQLLGPLLSSCTFPSSHAHRKCGI
ncbi:uncharacterized protein V6R79_026141 [Siganus canaliculatus]